MNEHVCVSFGFFIHLLTLLLFNFLQWKFKEKSRHNNYVQYLLYECESSYEIKEMHVIFWMSNNMKLF